MTKKKEAKKTKDKVEKVKETENETIVFKANRPLGEHQFKLLSDLVKYEEKKKGVNIVLMPYSCDTE